MSDYTPQELMVVAAAREILDGEVVFVGMRLPLLAFGLAKRTHAPSAIGLFENGLVRDRLPPPDLYTMSDAPNVLQAAWATGLADVMSSWRSAMRITASRSTLYATGIELNAL